MKKTYLKPTIQQMALGASSPLAASCEAIALFAENLCAVSVDVGFNMEIFQSADICDFHTPDVNDMVCYHAPADNNNVFTS